MESIQRLYEWDISPLLSGKETSRSHIHVYVSCQGIKRDGELELRNFTALVGANANKTSMNMLDEISPN